MSNNQQQSSGESRTIAEWVSLGIALLLLAGVFGAVIRLWVTSSNQPLRFNVAVGEAYYVDGQYYIPFSVTNDSRKTAAQVAVEGRLIDEDKEETVATTTFNFIAARSKTEGVLIFNNVEDPTETKVRVTSFQQP